MPVEVIMPKIDMDMTTGTIMVWHVAEGSRVEKGKPLFDIETDKAAMEVEAPDNGILHHPLAIGNEVPIGQTVGWLYAEGEAVGRAPSSGAPATCAPDPDETPPPVITPSAPAPAVAGNRIRATPVARKIAADKGIDLAEVKGTGPHGRIGKADMLAVVRKSPAPDSTPVPASRSILQMYRGREFDEIALDGIRRTVAARLTEAKQTIPHFYLRGEVNADALLKLRNEMNEVLAPRRIKLTVNDFIIRACALALHQVPDANTVWAGDRLLRFTRADITVAVAVDGGILTPIIRDADLKSLPALSTEMKELAARARGGKLKPTECTGGVLSISNLGMFGVDEFDAIINPPQSAVLAVGACRRRTAVGEDGKPCIASTIRLTLSVDHRSTDGALGAGLMKTITAGLERPMALLV